MVDNLIYDARIQEAKFGIFVGKAYSAKAINQV